MRIVTIVPMMAGTYREGPGSRRTPDIRRIRQTALALVSAGLYLGFAGSLLPLVAAHFTLSATAAEQWQFSVLTGGLTGALVGRSLARTRGGVRSVASAGAVAMVAAFGSLAIAPALDSLVWTAALLGAGLGLAAIASAYALDSVLATDSAFGTLDLAAACFGIGAASGCLLLVALGSFMNFDQLPVAAGGMLLVGSLLVWWWGAPPDAVPPIVLAHHWHDVVRPTRILLAIGLMLQSALWGVVAYWLGFYASRILGTTPGWSVGLLVFFWVGWIAGRTLAVRALALGLWRSTMAAAAVGLLGCLFLANTVELSGAIVGAILLGVASGSLQGLVQSMAGGHVVTLAMVGRFFAGSIMSGLLVAALTGSLIRVSGARSVIWVVALIGAALCFCLVILAIESRLDRSPAEV